MDLYALLLYVLTALHPRLELERRHEVADTIAAVVEDAPELRDPEGTALDLLTIVEHESSFHRSVEDCTRTGDHGRSISSFQIQRHTWAGNDRETICSSPRLAAELALRWWRRTGSFEGYAGCQKDLGCRAADEMKAIRAKYRRRAGR